MSFYISVNTSMNRPSFGQSLLQSSILTAELVAEGAIVGPFPDYRPGPKLTQKDLIVKGRQLAPYLALTQSHAFPKSHFLIKTDNRPLHFGEQSLAIHGGTSVSSSEIYRFGDQDHEDEGTSGSKKSRPALPPRELSPSKVDMMEQLKSLVHVLQKFEEEDALTRNSSEGVYSRLQAVYDFFEYFEFLYDTLILQDDHALVVELIRFVKERAMVHVNSVFDKLNQAEVDRQIRDDLSDPIKEIDYILAGLIADDRMLIKGLHSKLIPLRRLYTQPFLEFDNIISDDSKFPKKLVYARILCEQIGLKCQDMIPRMREDKIVRRLSLLSIADDVQKLTSLFADFWSSVSHGSAHADVIDCLRFLWDMYAHSRIYEALSLLNLMLDPIERTERGEWLIRFYQISDHFGSINEYIGDHRAIQENQGVQMTYLVPLIIRLGGRVEVGQMSTQSLNVIALETSKANQSLWQLSFAQERAIRSGNPNDSLKVLQALNICLRALYKLAKSIVANHPRHMNSLMHLLVGNLYGLRAQPVLKEALRYLTKVNLYPSSSEYDDVRNLVETINRDFHVIAVLFANKYEIEVFDDKIFNDYLFLLKSRTGFYSYGWANGGYED